MSGGGGRDPQCKQAALFITCRPAAGAAEAPLPLIIHSPPRGPLLLRQLTKQHASIDRSVCTLLRRAGDSAAKRTYGSGGNQRSRLQETAYRAGWPVATDVSAWQTRLRASQQLPPSSSLTAFALLLLRSSSARDRELLGFDSNSGWGACARISLFQHHRSSIVLHACSLHFSTSSFLHRVSHTGHHLPETEKYAGGSVPFQTSNWRQHDMTQV